LLGSLLQQAVPEQLLEAQKGSKPFPKAIAKFKPQAFPTGANPLLNPYLNALLKSSFSTIFQGPGPGELHFTLIGLFAGLTIAASCARAAPGNPEGKQAFSKSN